MVEAGRAAPRRPSYNSSTRSRMNPSNAITADALAGDEAMDDFAVGREHAQAIPTDRIERADRQPEGALGTPPSLPARVRQIVRPSRNFFERIYDNLEAFLSRLS